MHLATAISVNDLLYQIKRECHLKYRFLVHSGYDCNSAGLDLDTIRNQHFVLLSGHDVFLSAVESEETCASPPNPVID